MMKADPQSHARASDAGRAITAAYVAILSLMLAVLIRTAWMSDDAEITLRCVMNFIHGYGPTFNIDERVQAFTHPIWFLLISILTLVLRNIFTATFALSFACSLLTLWLLMSRVAVDAGAGIIAAGALILSKAFVDYSTSGLENPLSHLLLVYGLLLGFEYLANANRSSVPPLTVLGLSYLCHPDLVLLIVPFFLLILRRSYKTPEETIKIL